MSRGISVILVDDHVLFRQALRHLLETVPDIRVVAEASDGSAVERLVERHQPDVVVMDVSMSAIDGITAGERDGKIAEGLQHGNSPFEYPTDFIGGRTLVLTTTNGTKLLHMALDRGAGQIITGSFPNLGAVCDYLLTQNMPVVLACAAWKDKVNIEDLLFAGAVINKVKTNFDINCDSSQIAETLFRDAKKDLYEFMKAKNASHYQRLSGYGLEKDIRYCLTPDVAPVLPLYENGKLITLP